MYPVGNYAGLYLVIVTYLADFVMNKAQSYEMEQGKDRAWGENRER